MANPSERGGFNAPSPGQSWSSASPTSTGKPSEQGDSLKGQVSSMVGQARESIQGAASELSGRMSEMGQGIARGVREGEHWVEETAGDLWHSMEGVIRRNPTVAVLAAFGAGCLLTCCIAAWTSGPSDIPRRMSGYSA